MRLKRVLIAVCAGIVLALIAAFVSLLAGGAIKIEDSDLLVYYGAGHLVLAGHGAEVYTASVLRQVEQQFVHTGTVKPEATFLYPPYVALLLAPLAAVPLVAAYVLWAALSAGMLALSLFLLGRYVGWTGESRVLLWVATLAFLPAFAAIVQGQVSAAILLALTVSLVAARSGRDDLAGVALALALIKPPYVVPLLIVFLLRRCWRVVAAFVMTALVLALAPLTVLGWGANGLYLHTLLMASRLRTTGGGWAPAANHDLVGFTRLLLPEPTATVVAALLGLMAVVALGVVALQSAHLDRPFAVAVTVGLLINPHVLVHDLTIALIPAVVALWPAARGPWSARWTVALGYVAVLVGLRTVTVLPLQLSVLAVGALFAWLVLSARDQPAAKVTAAPR